MKRCKHLLQVSSTAAVKPNCYKAALGLQTRRARLLQGHVWSANAACTCAEAEVVRGGQLHRHAAASGHQLVVQPPGAARPVLAPEQLPRIPQPPPGRLQQPQPPNRETDTGRLTAIDLRWDSEVKHFVRLDTCAQTMRCCWRRPCQSRHERGRSAEKHQRIPAWLAALRTWPAPGRR